MPFMGKYIKELRERREITQEDLARAMCVNQSMIAHIELGGKIPSLILAKKMADFFGITVDDLLKGE